MRNLLFALILIPGTALAGPISKFEGKPPQFSVLTATKLEDVERCLIDAPDFGPAYVYRQPDRPDRVTITWSAGSGTTVARVDLSREAAGTKVVSWLELKKITVCVPEH